MGFIMKILLSFLILVSSMAFAGDVGPEKKFLVKAVSPDVDVSTLATPQVKILPAHRKVAYDSQLPSPADRDDVFQRSGLSGSIENWDDFDKDSLYIKLTKSGSKVIDRILIKYPDLNRASLEKAQTLIKAEDK